MAATRAIDKRRAEARDTRSGLAANARINNAVRSFKQEFVRKRLRGAIALRNGIGLEAACLLCRIERMKRAREIGEKVCVIECVLSLDATVLEKTPFMKRNLGNRCLDLEACVPGSALRAMKPPAERPRMSKGGIHDMSLRHSQKQLTGTDCPVTTVLRDLSLIRRSVELTQVRENIWRKRKAFKDALGTILRWDEPVG